MMNQPLKRSEFVFYYHKNGRTLDILSILSGKIKFDPVEQLLAFPVLLGHEVVIDQTDFSQLAKISTADWTEEGQETDFDEAFIDKYVKLGIILLKSDSPEATDFVRKEAILNDQKWNIYATFFHFMTKWKNINVNLAIKDYEGQDNIDLYHDSMGDVISAYGSPPHHFHQVSSDTILPLPLVDKKEDPYYQLLYNRKTGRIYDRNKALSLEKLSTLLFYTFGCHGLLKMHDELIVLKKFVPSGGSMHPTECYVLIINVEGLEPGVYHYNVAQHALYLVKPYDRQTAEEHANSFAAGQNYQRDANALFIMTSRFFRNFWKYQQHTIAYKVLMFDAAHLSQLFYMNCAKENLSCFVTGAVNATLVEEELGLDGFTEGATLVVGCGIPVADGDKNLLEPEFEPYAISRA